MTFAGISVLVIAGSIVCGTLPQSRSVGALHLPGKLHASKAVTRVQIRNPRRPGTARSGFS